MNHLIVLALVVFGSNVVRANETPTTAPNFSYCNQYRPSLHAHMSTQQICWRAQEITRYFGNEKCLDQGFTSCKELESRITSKPTSIRGTCRVCVDYFGSREL